MCQPCKKMCSYLDQLVRTAVSVTPARKASRQDPSSTCPISSLSPASQKKRKYNLMHERVEDKKRLRKYEHTELTLDDEQSDELSQIVQIISTESHGHTVLSQIFDEAEKQGRGQAVREIWESDIRSQFEKDQAKNGHFCSHSSQLNTSCFLCPPPHLSSLSHTHTHTHTHTRTHTHTHAHTHTHTHFHTLNPNSFSYFIIVETGKRSNRWSLVTIRIGMSCYN